MSDWEIWLDDPYGLRLQSLSPISFSVAKVANRIGAFDITFAGDFDTNPIKLDGLVEFWRGAEEGKREWVNIGMVRNIEYWQDGQGKDFITLSGPDIMDLLRRHIVKDYAGSAAASKTDYADDMIKAIITNQFGASAGTGRDLSSYISVAADTSLGYSLTKGFAYKNVYDIINDIANTSAENDLPIYFALVPYLSSNSAIKFRFETYLNQPGIDRTGTSQVIFGTNYDNIANCRLEYDFTNEINVVYGGGQGEGILRFIATVTNTERTAASPYNRREAFTDARNESANQAVTDKASAMVQAGRPVIRFSGQLKDIPPTRYGIDWSWGDKVIVQYRDIQQEAVVSAVYFRVGETGQEAIDARFTLQNFETYSGRLKVTWI